MHHPTDRIAHTTAFVTPVVEHWLEREIAQWVHPMKDRSDDPSHHERTLLPLSYISLPPCQVRGQSYRWYRPNRQRPKDELPAHCTVWGNDEPDRLARTKVKFVLFNDATGTHWFLSCHRLLDVIHMVTLTHFLEGNPLPPHRLLFSISSKGSFICTFP